jgi:hypothetical protein
MQVYLFSVPLGAAAVSTALHNTLHADFEAQQVFPGAWLIPWASGCRDLYRRTKALVPQGCPFLLTKITEEWIVSSS